ncbi:MAG: hypothetical protein JST69_12100 [Bacteroidetes bacterium]|nr:hypothetical protein [Bacteroidota bacterium]
MVTEKLCVECGEKMKGRSDRKFCSDQCRISYHNRHNSNTTNLVRNINNALRKNRRILLSLNPAGKTKVHRNKLTEQGFDFHLFTSLYTTKEGATYFYCYEQGYLQTDPDWFLLVVKK